MKILEKNTIYKNSWNIFSKSFLFLNNFEENNSNLIVVQNEKILNLYIKIFGFLWFNIKKVWNISDLVNIFFNKIGYYITTKEFFFQKINFWELENKNSLIFEKNKENNLEKVLEKLNDFWYKNSFYIENAKFKKSWDLLNIWDINLDVEYKISFWWDIVEDITIFEKKLEKFNLKNFSKKNNSNELKNNKKILKNKQKIFISENKKINILEDEFNENLNKEILEKINENKINIFLDNIDFFKNANEIYNFLEEVIIFSDIYRPVNEKWIFKKKIKNLDIKDIYLSSIEDFKKILNSKEKQILIFTKNKKTIKNFLDYNNIFWVKIIETKLNNLKSFEELKNIIICDDNISKIFIKKRLKKSFIKELDLLMQIKPWDYVVHLNHWVWIFSWIIEKNLAWIKREYIEIEYDKKDKLFVPITEISRINKYIWVENPKLTSLSWAEWTKKINKAKKEVLIIAWEILEIYAKRKLKKGFCFKSFEKLEIDFRNSFEYDYTSDQQKVIEEIFKDMESDIAMDRLLSWDVWFGKTEVAFNAIYKAILNGKQAILVTPLVVLAYEHFQKAQERFKNFPINIEVLTRFESQSKTKEVLKKIKDWKVDLVVWTHKLLNQDISFKDLWLIVLDEEHKFWVEHKEKLKDFRGNVDILSMSATPIPRSLNMALNGLKSISMLTTPPFWRKSIETIVANYDENIISEACKKEFERWWQVFFIHNRVATIESMKIRLEKILKNKKIVIVHWQLSWDELETRILAFKRRQYDVLLATTVIENWIDFSSVNTIFINDAYRFWISQIHQLRWRVGRADTQAYCYLFYRQQKLNEIAEKRLKTMVEYTHLWSWFELALKDLEIRWGWDILWLKQSWQVSEIWLNLFLTMLEEKIEELKKNSSYSDKKIKNEEKSEEKIIPAIIDLNIQAMIPDEFFNSNLDKINFYRELELINSIEDLKEIIKDFKNFNEKFPEDVENLFLLLKIRLLAWKYNISLIKKIWINYQLEFFLPKNISNNKNEEIKILKKFLDLDKKVKFTVFNTKILRSPIKNYSWDLDFLKYLEEIFEQKKFKIKKIVKK